MRKMFKAAASLAVGCAMLSTSAFAALTGTPALSDDRSAVNVTVSGVGADKESTILVLKGARTEMPATINEDDIVYINQKTAAADGTATYSMPLGTRVGDATAVTVFAGATDESTATLLGSVPLSINVPATGIVIYENSAAAADTKEMEIGATAAFTATVDPSTTTDTVSWTVKQGETDVTATVLTVADGTATFTAPTVEADTVYTVTATAGSVSDSIAITVKAAATNYILGDVNNDKAIDLSDALAVINRFMKGTEFVDSDSKIVPSSVGDVNKDGAVDLSDALAIINRFMKGTEF